MIDSSSPITIYTHADIREVLKVDVIFVRLEFCGNYNCRSSCGKRKIKNACIKTRLSPIRNKKEITPEF